MYFLPKYAMPEKYTQETFLYSIAEKGLCSKLKAISDKYYKRLAYEIDMLIYAGVVDYVLLIWDIVEFCKSEKIAVSARGTANSSLVNYALGISTIDPIKHELYFELYLNYIKLRNVDIDMNLAPDGVGKVYDYIQQKYAGHFTTQVDNRNFYAADALSILITRKKISDYFVESIGELNRDSIELFRLAIFDFIPLKPLDTVRQYKSVKKNNNTILLELIPETDGVIVFKEQIVKILIHLGGYSAVLAAHLTKFLHCENNTTSELHHKAFINGNKQLGIAGATNRGLLKRDAENIFKEIQNNCTFCLLKSHFLVNP